MKTTPNLLLALAAATLAGCNATPLDYHSPQEIPRGPGMFSGAEGGFVMRSKETKEVKPAPAISVEEYREFQDWREWRRQRDEAGKK